MAGGRQFSNQPVRIEEMKADFIRVPFDLTREYEEKLFAHYNREPYWKAQRELVSRH